MDECADWPRRSGQNVAIVRGKSHLLADVDRAAIHDGSCGPIHQAVDEWRCGVLKDLLDSAGKLVSGLGPIVVFHGDHENGFDSVFAIFRDSGQVAHYE
jgi:hypothetical protein